MKGNTTVILASAIAAALSLAVQASAGPAPAPKFEAEKCYGIAKAGHNDCETMSSSCAGTSRRNGQSDAWIYVPKGTCEKVVGGNMKSRQG
jgi:uncharacterized membrane protein